MNQIEPYLELRDQLLKQVDASQSRLFSIGMQLGTWLVVGNSIALYFLANSILVGHVANDAFSRFMYSLFVSGLACAFLALTLTFLLNSALVWALVHFASDLLGLWHRKSLREDLESINAAVPGQFDEADTRALDRFKRFQRRVPHMLVAQALLILTYLSSGVLLLRGIVAPLTNGLTIL
jgi:hypothetical protein